ncbi:hypothetical protein JHS3_06730 [Jeongeupia sp. HS-3]|nr:hypothetical protein JHS3_06730 [Jeongeupia sp. HS-3]
MPTISRKTICPPLHGEASMAPQASAGKTRVQRGIVFGDNMDILLNMPLQGDTMIEGSKG